MSSTIIATPTTASPPTSDRITTNSTIPPLLSLPFELRSQIYTILLTPPTVHDLIIRSLFIRQHYRNVFMTQQPKGICTALLRVCRQIYLEIVPILYAAPLWRCGCRAENLASQIGMANFGLIRRIQLDTDDLALVVGSLALETHCDDGNGGSGGISGGCRTTTSTAPKDRRGQGTDEGKNAEQRYGHGSLVQPEGQQRRQHHEKCVTPPPPPRLRFLNLELLLIEGYQTSAITSLGDKRVREEALHLCKLAQAILNTHPMLSLLVQRDKPRNSNGGSDAIDTTMGRVLWRFMRSERDRDVAGREYVVDLSEMMMLFAEMIEFDEREGVQRRSSLPTEWTDKGVFEQYPYLPSRVGSR